MRRLALFVAAALVSAGCRSGITAPGPLAYLCLPDAGAVGCPEHFRCGLEGRCHDTRVGSAYGCASDGDCEQGWACGPEGICHDPAAAVAFRCDDSRQCGAGWHCRPEHVCAARDAGGAPLACRDELDCALGWRCGIDAHCQNRSVGAAYPCRIDPDCEQGFRCDTVALTCADARRERLPYQASGALAPLNPGRSARVPDLLAGSLQLTFFPGSGTWGAISGTDVRLFSVSQPAAATAQLAVAPRAAAFADGQLWVLGPSGLQGLTTGGQPTASFASVEGEQLAGAESMVVAWSPDGRYTVVRPSLGDAGVRTLQFTFDGGAPQALDSLASQLTANPRCVFASAPEGLFVARFGAGGFLGGADPLEPQWAPVPVDALPNERCSGLPSRYRLQRLWVSSRFNNNPWVLAATAIDSTRPDAGTVVLALTTGPGPTDAGACALPPACGSAGQAMLTNLALGPCVPCAANELVDDVVVNGRGGLFVRCLGAADAGVVEVLAVDAGACETRPATGLAATWRRSSSGIDTDGRRIFAGSTGAVWASRAMLPDVVNRSPTLTLSSAPTLVWPTDAGAFDFAVELFPRRSLSSRWHPGFGVVSHGVLSTPSTRQVAAVFEGRPEWVVVADDHAEVIELSTGRSIASVLSGSVQDSVLHATAAPALDGSWWLALSIDGSIFAGRVPPGGGGQLELVGVPSSLPIDRLAMFVPGAPDTVVGFALATVDVVRFESSGGGRWAFSRPLLPDGIPTAVFSGSHAAWVAMQDGRIFGLDHRAAVAEPLPDGLGEATVVHECGVTLAAAGGSLYRVEPAADGGALGRWSSAALPHRATRLYTASGAMLVSSADGELSALWLDGGCPTEVP